MSGVAASVRFDAEFSTSILSNVIAGLVVSTIVLGLSIVLRVGALHRLLIERPFRARRLLPHRGQLERLALRAGRQAARHLTSSDHYQPADQLIDCTTRVERMRAPALDRAVVARAVARVARAASRRTAASMLARVFFAEDVQRVAEFEARVARLAESLGRIERVPLHRSGSFAEQASTFSGAPVLVDAMSSRARVFTDTVVWHSRHYVGLDTASSFEEAHAGGPCGAASAARLLPGDYDARVLTVRTAAVGLVEGTNAHVLLLDTDETCYATTELGSQRIGCKHLTAAPTGAPPTGPAVTVGANACHLDHSRTALLTSYLAIVSSDRHLLLAKRSRRVRSGLDVLSASAGGVVEPGAVGFPGDRTPDGLPDPITTAIRETQEEIGIVIDRSRVRPLCCFLANSVERNDPTHGQLVAAVLSFATVDRTVEEIRAHDLALADPALGRFEAEEIVAVDLAKGIEALASWVAAHADELDQHGLLSCLYVGALYWSPGRAMAAFNDAFRGTPWWRSTAPPRVCFDPSALVTP